MLKDPVKQGWQTAEEFAPIARENVPAAHGVHVEIVSAPTIGLKDPAQQGMQLELEDAPVRLLKVPAWQGMPGGVLETVPEGVGVPDGVSVRVSVPDGVSVPVCVIVGVTLLVAEATLPPTLNPTVEEKALHTVELVVVLKTQGSAQGEACRKTGQLQTVPVSTFPHLIVDPAPLTTSAYRVFPAGTLIGVVSVNVFNA